MNLPEVAVVKCNGGLNGEAHFEQASSFGLRCAGCFALLPSACLGRWFTPDNEMNMCVHASLAAAAALIDGMGNPSRCITFKTAAGELPIHR